MEIHFVTGKGGVGKSTWAAVLAHKFSSTKKTLLVELGDAKSLESLLSPQPSNGPSLKEIRLEAVPTKLRLQYTPEKLLERLWVASWTGENCLQEYARHLLKVESLADLLLQNKITKSLIQVAPALQELAILGKVTSGPPRNVGPKLDYDILVVDAFASGHFLNLLRSPKAMAEAIPYGPMGTQSRAIDQVLRSKQVHVHIVGLPEELPVVEAKELQASLSSEFGLQAHMILNKMKFLDFQEQSLGRLSPAMKSLCQQEQHWKNENGHKNWKSATHAPMVWSSTPQFILNELLKVQMASGNTNEQ